MDPVTATPPAAPAVAMQAPATTEEPVHTSAPPKCDSDSYNRLCPDSAVPLTSASFKWMKPLGTGQFGKVYKGREKVSGERRSVALKVMDLGTLKERDMISQAHVERRVHALVSGAGSNAGGNICEYLGFFECPRRKALVLVMENCPDGTLYDAMKARRSGRFEERTAARYVSQLARALQRVHAAGCLHRDLKPENVLMDGDVCKLADFGWACHAPTSDERCGSLDYMSPQMVQLVDYAADVDCWALGVLGFELLTGQPPFERTAENLDVGQMRHNTLARIERCEYSWPQRPSLSKDARSCIDGLLTFSPVDRLTLEQVLDHPWIVKHTSVVK